MKQLRVLIPFVLAAFFVGGCVGRAHVRAHARIDTTPTLVSIAPGVWVIEDHHEPVFYSNGSYWLYDGGVWYRTHSHGSAWVKVRTQVVPRAVVRIDRPRTYVRYHARAGARVKQGPKGKVQVRDHRKAKRDHRRAKRDHRRTDRDHRRDDRKPKHHHRKGKGHGHH